MAMPVRLGATCLQLLRIDRWRMVVVALDGFEIVESDRAPYRPLNFDSLRALKRMLFPSCETATNLTPPKGWFTTSADADPAIAATAPTTTMSDATAFTNRMLLSQVFLTTQVLA